MTCKFYQLHDHTEKSLNDGMIKVKKLAKKLKEQGVDKFAVTEHGEMMDMPAAYLALKDEGVELIVGMETYVAPRKRSDKEKSEGDDANYHLVLLAENNEGYDNLKILASEAALNGFYYKPRVDKELLRQYHKGIIASSACLGGSINQFLLEDKYEEAKSEALEYLDIFGEGNFFLELQRHGLREQEQIESMILRLSRETGIPLVATNDCHYLNKEDWEAHDILMAIQAGTTIDDTKRKIYTSHEFYVKSPEEMIHLFRDVPEAIENTVKIAERCHVELEFGVNKIPPFKLPNGYKGKENDFLREIVEGNARIKYSGISEEVQERIDFELEVIERMGYVNYFLINWDFFRFCREGTYEIEDAPNTDWDPILTGPGRGCFKPNQKVYLSNGNIKNIQDVEIGDEVITRNGSEKVYTTFEYDIDEEMTDIQVGGEHIVCTNDHKLLAIKEVPCLNPVEKNVYCNPLCNKYSKCKFKQFNKPEWIEAKELSKADYLVMQKNQYKDNITNSISLNKYLFNNKLENDIEVTIDDDFGLISGLFIGNGWVRYNKEQWKFETGFALNCIQFDKYKDFITGYLSKFMPGTKWTEKWNTRHTCCSLRFNGKVLAEFFKNIYGKGAINKHIPDELMLNKLCLNGLIEGLFKTDGHVPEREKIAYSTTSEALAHQIKIILMNENIYSSLIYRKRSSRNPNWRTEIKVSLSSVDARRIYKIINKVDNFECRRKAETVIHDNDYIYKRIYNTNKCNYKGKVYDLGVENEANYNINGYIVHNSGAGSIVAYCTDITKIEPLQFNLLFERFLSPERVSMPDIDSDFEDTRRQEVIDYVVYKYGRECISQIITFGTLAARAVIRRVGKALDYPYAVCDKIAKSIPAEVGITIEKALAVNQSLRKAYDTDKSIKRLLDFSMQLEGLATSCGTHAAGVLITDKKGVTAHVPLWENKGGIVAQFSKDYIEMLGLLKMDFLGLGTLGILGDAKRMIRANHGVNIDFDELYKLPTMEPLQLIRDGKTECLFQLNGAGMTAFMKELKPNSIEDIILGISMYRPGPMAEIPKLLYGKRNPDKVTYEVDGLKYILDPTYGSIVYQEQCMQIVVAIAGFSKSDSDNFRRIISKKKLKEMPKQREWFVHGRKKDDYDYEGHLRHYKADILGGVALGHSEEALNKLFDKMVDFAAYAFNKSHAAAYAFVGYLTAWFMKYYPVEFMAANLNAVQKNRAKIARYMNYARKELNLEILEPDINESVERFKATKDGKIMYTLSIKGASIDCLKRIVEERETNGKFENLIDFIARTRNFLDKKTYEGLIGSGALKCFGIIKSQHLAALDDFWDGCLKKTKDSEKNALKKNKDFNFEEILLGKIDGLLPNINEYPKDIDLRLEKEFLGMYLTDNPLYRYAYTIKTSNNFELSDVDYEVDEETGIIMMSNDSVRDRQKVRFVTILNDVAELTTKKKTLMARLELEDLTGIAGALIWPSTYDSIKSKLKKNEIYMCHGYLMVSSDEAPTIVVEDMELMEEMVTERAIISVENKEEAVDIINYINDNDMAKGMTPVYLVYNNLQTLLTRHYWINLNHMNQKYKDKIKIKIW